MSQQKPAALARPSANRQGYSNSKNYLVGSAVKNERQAAPNSNGRSNIPSPARRHEEQKRANSVASGDTIISTASSSSPMKRGLHRKNMQANGLQIMQSG